MYFLCVSSYVLILRVFEYHMISFLERIGYSMIWRYISGRHGYALALKAPLGDPLLGVPLRGGGGGSLTTPPHSLWHASRDTKLLALPWQLPYQNSVHLPVPESQQTRTFQVSQGPSSRGREHTLPVDGAAGGGVYCSKRKRESERQ